MLEHKHSSFNEKQNNESNSRRVALSFHDDTLVTRVDLFVDAFDVQYRLHRLTFMNVPFSLACYLTSDSLMKIQTSNETIFRSTRIS